MGLCHQERVAWGLLISRDYSIVQRCRRHITMSQPDIVASRLVERFRQIHQERMQGIPILNHVLEVQSIGFREWGQHCIGILVTPWFMNLMVIPGEQNEWVDKALGAKVEVDFPSGPRQFQVNAVDGFGPCLSCALHSPMSCFDDQASAIARAEDVLLNLMDESQRVEPTQEEERIEAFLRGEEMQAPEDELEENPIAVDEQAQPLSEKLQEPLSRRDMLRGLLPS